MGKEKYGTACNKGTSFLDFLPSITLSLLFLPFFFPFPFCYSLLPLLPPPLSFFLDKHYFNTHTVIYMSSTPTLEQTVWVEGGCTADAPNNNRKGVRLALRLFLNPSMCVGPTFREQHDATSLQPAHHCHHMKTTHSTKLFALTTMMHLRKLEWC